MSEQVMVSTFDGQPPTLHLRVYTLPPDESSIPFNLAIDIMPTIGIQPGERRREERISVAEAAQVLTL